MRDTTNDIMQMITEILLGPSLNIAVVLGLLSSLITIWGLFKSLYAKNYEKLGRKVIVIMGVLSFPILALWLSANYRADYLNTAIFIFAGIYITYAALCTIIVSGLLWQHEYLPRDYASLTILTVATYLYGLVIFVAADQSAQVLSLLFLFSLFVHSCLMAHKFVLRYYWPKQADEKHLNTSWMNLGIDSIHFLCIATLAIIQIVFLQPTYINRLGLTWLLFK